MSLLEHFRVNYSASENGSNWKLESSRRWKVNESGIIEFVGAVGCCCNLCLRIEKTRAKAIRRYSSDSRYRWREQAADYTAVFQACIKAMEDRWKWWSGWRYLTSLDGAILRHMMVMMALSYVTWWSWWRYLTSHDGQDGGILRHMMALSYVTWWSGWRYLTSHDGHDGAILRHICAHLIVRLNLLSRGLTCVY